MTHDSAHPLLARYAAGELDLPTAAAVRRHLVAGCRECLFAVIGVRAQGGRPTVAERPRPTSTQRDGGTVPAAAAVVVPVPTTRDGAMDLPPSPATSPDQAPPTAPITSKRWAPSLYAAVIVALVVVAAAVLFAMQVREARFVDQLQRLTARLSELSFDRAKLFDRLAALTRELDDAREAERQHALELERLTQKREEIEAAATARFRPDPDLGVHYADDALTVRVGDTPVADLLREISDQAGITIRGALTDGRVVSVEFERVPLLKALRRLLRDQNFKLTYDHDRRPRLLELLSAPGGDSQTAQWMMIAPSSGQVSAPLAPSLESTVALLAERPAVPVDGALGEAMGTGSMSLLGLIDTGVLHRDRAVRGEAWRAAVNELQNDPELRSAIVGALGGNDDSSLGDFVLGIADERAQEALFYLATQARNSALRNKAATLLHELHVQSSAAPGTQSPGG